MSHCLVSSSLISLCLPVSPLVSPHPPRYERLWKVIDILRKVYPASIEAPTWKQKGFKEVPLGDCVRFNPPPSSWSKFGMVGPNVAALPHLQFIAYRRSQDPWKEMKTPFILGIECRTPAQWRAHEYAPKLRELFGPTQVHICYIMLYSRVYYLYYIPTQVRVHYIYCYTISSSILLILYIESRNMHDLSVCVRVRLTSRTFTQNTPHTHTPCSENVSIYSYPPLWLHVDVCVDAGEG